MLPLVDRFYSHHESTRIPEMRIWFVGLLGFWAYALYLLSLLLLFSLAFVFDLSFLRPGDFLAALIVIDIASSGVLMCHVNPNQVG